MPLSTHAPAAFDNRVASAFGGGENLDRTAHVEIAKFRPPTERVIMIWRACTVQPIAGSDAARCGSTVSRAANTQQNSSAIPATVRGKR